MWAKREPLELSTNPGPSGRVVEEPIRAKVSTKTCSDPSMDLELVCLMVEEGVVNGDMVELDYLGTNNTILDG